MQCFPHGVSEARRVARRDDDTVLAGRDQVRHGADPGGDDRCAARKALEHHVRASFAIRRQHPHVGRTEVQRYALMRLLAGQQDAVLKPEPTNKVLQATPVRAAAGVLSDDDQPHVTRKGRDGLDQFIVPLGALEVGDGDDQRAVRRQSQFPPGPVTVERPEPIHVYPVRDHVQPVARNAEFGGHVGHFAADADDGGGAAHRLDALRPVVRKLHVL